MQCSQRTSRGTLGRVWTRTRLVGYWCEVVRSALSERVTFLVRFHFLYASFFSLSPGFQVATGRWRFPGTVPFNAAGLPSVGSTRGGASSLPANPAVRTSLRRSSTSCSPFRGSLLLVAHLAPARPLSPASQLHAQARLVVAFCACALPHHTRRDSTRRVLQQWLFLSPASELDAGGFHGVSLPHSPSPSPTWTTPARSTSTT